MTLAHGGLKAIGYGGPVLREIAGSGFFCASASHRPTTGHPDQVGPGRCSRGKGCRVPGKVMALPSPNPRDDGMNTLSFPIVDRETAASTKLLNSLTRIVR